MFIIPSKKIIVQEKSRRNFKDFISYTDESFIFSWHHQIACQSLNRFAQRMIRKESPRLIISMPPGHSKSQLASRAFPSFILGLNPKIRVIAASWGADFSRRFNRDVQRIISNIEYRDLFKNTTLSSTGNRDSNNRWIRQGDYFEIVEYGGYYKNIGVCGGIAGMRADCLIIDDPIKNAQEAGSRVRRDAIWEWFYSDAITRLATGAGIIIIMTRWHVDDLVGLVLKNASDDDKWEVIKLPAIAEENEEFRKKGDALFPEMYSKEYLLTKVKPFFGTRQWNCLYQQNPSSSDESIIKLEWFQRYDSVPHNPQRVVFSLDTAYQPEKHNDPNVCMVFYVYKNAYYIVDIWREQVIYPDLKRKLAIMIDKYNPSEILIEKASSGQSLIQELKNATKRPIHALTPNTGDKVMRISLQAGQIESGLVFIPNRASWLYDFETEITQFPNSTHDDQIDALSQFLKREREVAGMDSLLKNKLPLDRRYYSTGSSFEGY
jgi:predicted phage terminase large subunit-like protein